jgi:hypothetical protein
MLTSSVTNSYKRNHGLAENESAYRLVQTALGKMRDAGGRHCAPDYAVIASNLKLAPYPGAGRQPGGTMAKIELSSTTLSIQTLYRMFRDGDFCADRRYQRKLGRVVN